MFGVRRARDDAPYAKKVATVLFRDGFDPRTLDEMQTLGPFSQGSRIFRILADKGLKPAQAALALRLASYRYQATRRIAETLGWPLKNGPARAPAPHEAYFLELLDEAVEILRAIN